MMNILSPELYFIQNLIHFALVFIDRIRHDHHFLLLYDVSVKTNCPLSSCKNVQEKSGFRIWCENDSKLCWSKQCDIWIFLDNRAEDLAIFLICHEFKYIITNMSFVQTPDKRVLNHPSSTDKHG